MKITNLLKPSGPRWMGPVQRRIPYPLRAFKISIDINPFGPWWKPELVDRRCMSEDRKRAGESQLWIRWLWIQISFSRWV